MTDGRPAPLGIRVALSTHLRTLARVGGEVVVEVEPDGSGGASARRLLDALEARHPVLRGTIRDHGSGERRAYLRYFAGTDDLSHEPPDARLPEAVLTGDEAFRIVGAIAGG